MNKLTFRTYSFASLPSGTYLFFPCPVAGSRAAANPDVGAEAEPERVVVSTFPGAKWSADIGIAACGTLFIDMHPERFDALLQRLRNTEKSVITFSFELDEEETLTSLEFEVEPISHKRMQSGIPPAGKQKAG